MRVLDSKSAAVLHDLLRSAVRSLPGTRRPRGDSSWVESRVVRLGAVLCIRDLGRSGDTSIAVSICTPAPGRLTTGRVAQSGYPAYMDIQDLDLRFGSAGRNDQLRPLTPSESEAEEERAKIPMKVLPGGRAVSPGPSPLQIVGGEVLDGPEHAHSGGPTLCGIPKDDIFVMRHLFYPEGRFSCPVCAALARADRN